MWALIMGTTALSTLRSPKSSTRITEAHTCTEHPCTVQSMHAPCTLYRHACIRYACTHCARTDERPHPATPAAETGRGSVVPPSVHTILLLRLIHTCRADFFGSVRRAHATHSPKKSTMRNCVRRTFELPGSAPPFRDYRRNERDYGRKGVPLPRKLHFPKGRHVNAGEQDLKMPRTARGMCHTAHACSVHALYACSPTLAGRWVPRNGVRQR